jgi:hypothetical protein
MAIEVLFLSGLAIDHHAFRRVKLNPLALPKTVFISSTRNQHFKLTDGAVGEIQIIP